MIPINDYLQLKPVKEGMIAVEGNEYEVLQAPLGNEAFGVGDIIIVEDHLIVKVVVKGVECFFVKIENVIAQGATYTDGPKENH